MAEVDAAGVERSQLMAVFYQCQHIADRFTSQPFTFPCTFHHLSVATFVCRHVVVYKTSPVFLFKHLREKLPHFRDHWQAISIPRDICHLAITFPNFPE